MKDKHINQELIESMVRYLNFRAVALSRSNYDRDDPIFAPLSPIMKREISLKLYVPKILEVRFFGYREEDVQESEFIEKLFKETNGGQTEGGLSRDELGKLMKDLSLKLTPPQLEQCFNEMDSSGSGEITFFEFQLWWNAHKYGLPSIGQAPMVFIEALAMCLTTGAYTVGEEVIGDGCYGEKIIFLVGGEVTVYKHADEHSKYLEAMQARNKWTHLTTSAAPDEKSLAAGLAADVGSKLISVRPADAVLLAKETAILAKKAAIAALHLFRLQEKIRKRDADKPEREMLAGDRTAVIGVSAALSDELYAVTRKKTEHWVARASTYVDTFAVNRKDFRNCLRKFWPGGETNEKNQRDGKNVLSGC